MLSKGERRKRRRTWDENRKTHLTNSYLVHRGSRRLLSAPIQDDCPLQTQVSKKRSSEMAFSIGNLHQKTGIDQQASGEKRISSVFQVADQYLPLASRCHSFKLGQNPRELLFFFVLYGLSFLYFKYFFEVTCARQLPNRLTTRLVGRNLCRLRTYIRHANRQKEPTSKEFLLRGFCSPWKCVSVAKTYDLFKWNRQIDSSNQVTTLATSISIRKK